MEMAFPPMSYSHCFSSMPSSTPLSPPLPSSLSRTSPSNLLSSNPLPLGSLSPPSSGAPSLCLPPHSASSLSSGAHSYPTPAQFGSLFPSLHPHAMPPSDPMMGPPGPQTASSLYGPGGPYSSSQNPYFPMGPPTGPPAGTTDPTSAFYHSLGHSSSYSLKDSRNDPNSMCRPPTLSQTPYPYEHAWAHAYHYPTNSYSIGLDGSRRKNATRESTATLKAWLQEHIKNPYPTKGEKIMLAIITKMTLTQVSTWFANARRRLKKENKMTWCPKNKTDEDGDMGDDDDKLDHDDDDDADDHVGGSNERRVGGLNIPTGAQLSHGDDSKGSSFDKSHTEGHDQSSGSLEVDLSGVESDSLVPSLPSFLHHPSSASVMDSAAAKIWRLAPSCLPPVSCEPPQPPTSCYMPPPPPPLHFPHFYHHHHHQMNASHHANSSALHHRQHPMDNSSLMAAAATQLSMARAGQ